MSIYQIKSVQRLPISLSEAWAFFSSPYNLEEITPADMSFHILSDVKGVKMYPGMIICYYVTPIFGIKMEWVTEITHVRELEYFVDEQRFGPYAMWHHQHHFKEIPGGIEMTDIIDYRLPLGVFGKLAHWMFVNKKLNSVFEYRRKILEERFGTLII